MKTPIECQRLVNGNILCNTLKFCKYAYSVLALNLTRDMGTSSGDSSDLIIRQCVYHVPYRIYCQKPGKALLCSRQSVDALVYVEATLALYPFSAHVCDVPGPALFDFGDVELEEVVQPGDEFLSVRKSVVSYCSCYGLVAGTICLWQSEPKPLDRRLRTLILPS